MSVDIHALSGAYAVDAVDEFERAQFERHLTGCASCRAEVASLREAGALLAETSTQAPPDSLRASVLAGIQNVRPLPPVVIAAAERGRSTRRRFPALVAAAAALIAIGGIGATAVGNPFNDDQVPVSQAQNVRDAADAETFQQPLRGGGTMTVVRSKSLNQAVVSTDGLPVLTDDLTYELWLIHGDTRNGKFIKAGLMDGDASWVLLEGEAATAVAAGVTIEAAGGADAPNLSKLVGSVPFERA